MLKLKVIFIKKIKDNKRVKAVAAIALGLALAFTLAGCGEQVSKDKNKEKTASIEQDNSNDTEKNEGNILELKLRDENGVKVAIPYEYEEKFITDTVDGIEKEITITNGQEKYSLRVAYMFAVNAVYKENLKAVHRMPEGCSIHNTDNHDEVIVYNDGAHEGFTLNASCYSHDIINNKMGGVFNLVYDNSKSSIGVDANTAGKLADTIVSSAVFFHK